MTVKEAVISELGFAPGNQNIIDKALIDNVLAGADNYTTAISQDTVKTCVLQICRILYSTADVTTSNAGVVTNSIRYDRAYLKERIKQLEADLGIVAASPVITSKSVW